MRIVVPELPEPGVVLEVGAGPEWALRGAELALDGPVAALEGRLEVRRTLDGVVVTGHLVARQRRACDRCAEEIEVEVGGPVELRYVVRAPGEPAVRDLAPDELDVGFFDGVHLDLADVVVEHLVLSLPDRVRCGDPGVEPGAACTPPGPGESPAVDPRLAILQNFSS